MFTGSIVALVTPMNEDGKVCRTGLKKLIDYHVASGTAAIVSVGTTGESATLSHDEHGDVVMTTLELAAGRIPVIAGTGANSTAEAISLTQRFNDTGVAGCLTVTPYYNRPSQEGMFRHFKTIAEHSSLPQILYNVPARTGCDLLPETVARLAEIDNIVGIKEASGNVLRVHQIKALVAEEFILLSGDDVSAMDFMQLGGQGVISVTANAAAREMAQMCQLATTGQYSQARQINQQLLPLHHGLFVEPNPVPVKWACKALGLIQNDAVRLPLVPLTVQGRNVVSAALAHANLL